MEAVRKRLAQSVDLVRELFSVSGQFVGEQHLGGGIARGEEILQQISRVVPAAPGVEMRAVGERCVRCAAVERVAHRIQPGVVTAALLAHELEQLIGHLAVGRVADGERQRLALTKAQHIAARRFEGREVQFRVVLELAPGRAGERPGLAIEHNLAGVRRRHCE